MSEASNVATDGIRPMSLAPPRPATTSNTFEPLGESVLGDEPLALTSSSGGSGSGGGGSGGGADLSISFTGGGAPVHVDDEYFDAIGNEVTVRVESGNDTMTSVKWIVSGGIKDYIFTVDKAEIIPFGQVEHEGQMVSGEVHDFDPTATSDTLNVIWDQPGTFSITAEASFSNNPSVTESITVNVQEPNVDEFKNEQKPFIFKNVNDQAFGLIHQAFDPALPGNKFTAQVDTVPKPENKDGQFAFLQTIEDWQMVVELKNGQKPIDINVAEVILDNWVGEEGLPFFMKGYTSQIYAAATDNIQLPDGTFPIVDSPFNLVVWDNQYPDPNGFYVARFVLKAEYTTHLMFRPDSSGHWISIASLAWGLDGTAQWDGPDDGPVADYLDETKWNVNIVKPTQADTLDGTPGIEFVEWNGKASDH